MSVRLFITLGLLPPRQTNRALRIGRCQSLLRCPSHSEIKALVYLNCSVIQKGHEEKVKAK